MLNLKRVDTQNGHHLFSTSSRQVPELGMLLHSQFIGQMWDRKEIRLTSSLAGACTGAVTK